MKPITFGVQLVLTYNLHIISSPQTLLVYNERDLSIMQERVRRVLKQWTGKPSMLWYFLEHEYSDNFLHQKLLRDNDAFQFEVLKAACDSAGYTVLFGDLCMESWDYSDYESDMEGLHGDEHWIKDIVHTDGYAFCSKLELLQSEVVQKHRVYKNSTENAFREISPGRYEE